MMLGGTGADDLSSLIVGLRSNKGSEHDYVVGALRSIRREVQTGSWSEKAEAILKLAYLSMLGYDMSWASFAVVELLGHSTFELKKSAFLACALSFTGRTPAALLSINSFRKDLQSNVGSLPSAALSCLGSMMSEEVARHLASDIAALTTHSKPQLRRKAIACLFRVVVKYPPSLVVCLPKLKDGLKDDNPSVVASTAAFVLELVSRNPLPYVKLVPTIYELASNQPSNWTILKLLRTLDHLCSVEPRLPPKLVSMLTTILQSPSTAKSVEYEAIRLTLARMPVSLDLTRTALKKLNQQFIHSQDVNLNCVGLRLLANALKRVPPGQSAQPTTGNAEDGCEDPAFLKVVQEIMKKDLLLQTFRFLTASDKLLKKAAAEVMQRSVDRSNFSAACNVLIGLANSRPYEAATFYEMLIDVGGRRSFGLISDLQMYFKVLLAIATAPCVTVSLASAIVRQLSQLALQVPSFRPLLLRAVSALPLLLNRVKQDAKPNPLLQQPLPPSSSPPRSEPSGSAGNSRPSLSQRGSLSPIEDEAMAMLLNSAIELLGVYSDALSNSLADESEVKTLNEILSVADRSYSSDFLASLVGDFLQSALYFAKRNPENVVCSFNCFFGALKLFQLSRSNDESIVRDLKKAAETFSASPASALQSAGRLFLVLCSQEKEGTEACENLHSLIERSDKADTEAPETPDLETPFFQQIAAQTSFTQEKGTPTTAEVVEPPKKVDAPRQYNIVKESTSSEPQKALQFLNNLRKPPPQWSCVFQDNNLALYAKLVGREKVGPTSSEEERGLVAISYDVRCANLLQKERSEAGAVHLKNILLCRDVIHGATRKWPTASSGGVQESIEIELTKVLTDRSKKRRVSFTLPWDSILSSETFQVPLQYLDGNDQTVLGEAQFSSPFELLLQKTDVDEDAAAVLLKVNSKNLSCKVECQTVYELPTPPPDLNLIDVIENILKAAADRSNFHSLPKRDVKSGKLSCLILSHFEKPDFQLLRGLVNEEEPLASIAGFASIKLPTPSSAESVVSLETHVVMRSNDMRLSQRALDLILLNLRNETGTAEK